MEFGSKRKIQKLDPVAAAPIFDHQQTMMMASAPPNQILTEHYPTEPSPSNLPAVTSVSHENNKIQQPPMLQCSNKHTPTTQVQAPTLDTHTTGISTAAYMYTGPTRQTFSSQTLNNGCAQQLPSATPERSFNIGGNRQVTVKIWNSRLYVNIRQFIFDQGTWKATRNGINLSGNEWMALYNQAKEINEAVTEITPHASCSWT